MRGALPLGISGVVRSAFGKVALIGFGVKMSGPATVAAVRAPAGATSPPNDDDDQQGLRYPKGVVEGKS